MTTTDQKVREFSDNVWNHSVDEFQATFDDRRPLNTEELQFLVKLTTDLEKNPEDNSILPELRKLFLVKDNMFVLLLQLCGLTRNKVIQDLKGNVGSNRAGMSFAGYKALYTNQLTWNLAGPYLLKKISSIFVSGANLSPLERVFETLNQATWSGYIRQERAKRSGHEAESRMANLLLKLGIPFMPTEKADNPMCRDVQINSVSFDLVIPNSESPKICIKSTVHTANIGQYGESKDHLEMDEARRMIDDMYDETKKPLLVAFIDGVGFESNRAGLQGVLSKSDFFVQFKTIWKLIVIASSATNKKCFLSLNQEAISAHQEFLSEFSENITLINLSNNVSAIKAGEALVLVR